MLNNNQKSKGANFHHHTADSVAYFLPFLFEDFQVMLSSLSLTHSDLRVDRFKPNVTSPSLYRPFSLAYFNAELPVSKHGRISCPLSKPRVDSSKSEKAIAEGRMVSGTAATHP